MARFPNCVVRAAPFLSAIFVAPLLITTGAQATTLFSASASASASVSLTVTGITNLTSGDPFDIEILGGVFETDPFGSAPLAEVFTVGAASGSTTSAVSPGLTPTDYDDPTALRIGDSLTIDLTASGTPDPIGYADAFNAAFGLITIENLSMSDTVEFSFELVVDLMTDASVDDFLLEDALAFAGVDAYSVFSSGLDFIETVEADALFGPPVSSFSNLGTLLAFSLIIDPEDFEDIEIFVEVNGFAEEIPALGCFVFILAGIALIGVRRQRSRARL